MHTANRRISEAYGRVVENGNFVVPTMEWLAAKYDEFNARMFGGSLQHVEFEIPTESSTNMGETPLMYSFDTDSIYCERIRINDAFAVKNNVLEDLLLHEMIHVENIMVDAYGVFADFNRGGGGHKTDIFTNELRRINANFGRNVVIEQPIHDTTKYVLSKTGGERLMKERDATVIYFVRKSNDLVDVFRIFDKNSENFDSEIAKRYGSVEIDRVKPKSSAFLEIPRSESDGSHIELAAAKASELKRRLLEEPQTALDEGDEMPELFKEAAAHGLPVIKNRDGIWEVTMGDKIY